MAQIKRTVVASGIIGEYNHQWEVHKLYDEKYDSECYNLYINKDYVDCYPSVAKAIVVLVENFKEQQEEYHGIRKRNERSNQRSH